MTYTMDRGIIFSIDDNKNHEILFGDFCQKPINKIDRSYIERRKLAYEVYELHQSQTRQDYLKAVRGSSVVVLATIQEVFKNKAHSKFQTDDNRVGAEAYLNKAMSQLAILRDKLLNETFKIDDLQSFVDETESVNDWQLIKLVIELIYLFGKKEVETIVAAQDKTIAHKDSELHVFREREEVRKSRQQQRVSMTNTIVREKADSNAVRMQPIFKEINDAGFISLRDMATALNERNIPCLNGGKKWFATTVRMVKIRIAELEAEAKKNQAMY